MKVDNENVLMNKISSDLCYIHRVYTMLINNSMIELELDCWAVIKETS